MTSDQTGYDEDRSRVVSQATARAAERLGLSDCLFVQVLGVPETIASQLRAGSYTLRKGTRTYEQAVLLLRLYKALSAILNDDESMRSWMRSHNRTLGKKPIDMISSEAELMSMTTYVESWRDRL